MSPSYKLSPNFTYKELVERSGMNGEPLPGNILENATAHAQVLERVRRVVGDRPVTVNSWYRTAEHNKAVKGEPDSKHLQARGADIKVAGMTPREVMRALQAANPKALGIESAIEYATHVHVGTSPTPRGALYTKTATGYVPWTDTASAPQVKAVKEAGTTDPAGKFGPLVIITGLVTAVAAAIAELIKAIKS